MTINIGSEDTIRLDIYRIETTQSQTAEAASTSSRTKSSGAVALQSAVLEQPGRFLVQIPGIAATNLPQLTAPRAGAEQQLPPIEMASIVQPLAEGTDVIGNAFVGALIDSAAKDVAGSRGRLSGFLMGEADVDVLLMMSAEWQKAQVADRRLQSEMTTLASKAAVAQSDSQIAAGNDAFASAVSASALSAGMQVMGTVVRVGALNKEHASLKVNTQNAQDSNTRENLINRELRSAQAIRPSEINEVTVGSGVERRTLRLEEDQVRITARDQARLSETAVMSGSRAGDASTQHALNQRAWGRDYAKADLWRMGGDVSAKMVDGMGQMEQSKERAQQTIDQNQQEVSRSNASLHEESARQSRAIAQEMHTITNQLINNISSVAARVASNLRA
ncbi:IpaC/SipC family type III secretion system effector [Xanthomonas albilineans]|uniref:IpaC/SipC family type III secretion system effector n=1 Tax=Xanthomonas albilineans TaxID=29447 RepID=UPI00030AD1AD|nr:IpaC/SipC family type III secretion system effector [Xanthomonas albilineans]QHQ28231.1 hypothetical protein XaFJ1_GM001488 [Xanthomonas albilineans]